MTSHHSSSHHTSPALSVGNREDAAIDLHNPTTIKLDRVLKMKGLPFKANVEDVLAFYQSYGVGADGVFLKRNADGKLNGEAYVVFHSHEEQDRAKSDKNRKQFGPHKFGDRFVKLFSVGQNDQADFIMTVQQKLAPPGSKTDCVVKVKYLPQGASQMDIIQYFSAFAMKPNGVQIVVRPDNSPTQEAFVDFETPQEAQRAIEQKNNRQPFNQVKFGDRYVQLIQVSRKEMQTALSLRFGGEGILKMKGIPFNASSEDVRLFLTGFQLKESGISFIMRDDGTSSGMAFIEFETPQEALRCLEAKHRKQFGPKFGNRFCQLEPVGRQQMEKAKLVKEQVPQVRYPAYPYQTGSQGGNFQDALLSALTQLNLANHSNKVALGQPLVGNNTAQHYQNLLAQFQQQHTPPQHPTSLPQILSGVSTAPLPFQSQAFGSNLMAMDYNILAAQQRLKHLQPNLLGGAPLGPPEGVVSSQTRPPMTLPMSDVDPTLFQQLSAINTTGPDYSKLGDGAVPLSSLGLLQQTAVAPLGIDASLMPQQHAEDLVGSGYDTQSLHMESIDSQTGSSTVFNPAALSTLVYDDKPSSTMSTSPHQSDVLLPHNGSDIFSSQLETRGSPFSFGFNTAHLDIGSLTSHAIPIESPQEAASA